MRAVTVLTGLTLLPALSLASNSVTITELTGAQQTSRPFSISRVFAQGEIASYAQPSIGGNLLAIWQCDRKSQWADGSLKHAIISFATTLGPSASVTVSFVNNAASSSAGSPLSQAQMLNFDPGTGPGTWGGDIEATANTTQTANVRTMLAAGSWRYWLQGPVVTQVIVEDQTPTRAYDFGWQCAGGCTGPYNSVTWSQAKAPSVYQSLHPIFVVTFYAGWAGAQIDYIVENPWTDRLQDQAYSLALKAHSDLSISKYTHATMWHNAGTRWRRRYWDGNTPGKVKLDLNFPYMVQSHALANWDQTRIVGCCGPTTAGGLEIANFQSSMVNPSTFLTDLPENLTDPRSTGEYAGDMGTTGGRGEIGPLPRWDVRWFYTMNEGLYRVMIGNADSLGGIPFHIREARTDNYFLSSSLEPTPTTKAVGHYISVDARPTGYYYNIYYGSGSDPIIPVGTIRCSNALHGSETICTTQIPPDASTPLWCPDIAHIVPTAYTAYLATGDWFFLQELYANAQWGAYYDGPNSDVVSRSGSTGYINDIVFNIRGGTWGVRNLALAASIAPATDKESQYLTEKVQNNIAVREGKFNIGPTARYYGTASYNFGNTLMMTMNQTRAGTPPGSTTSNPWSIPDFAMYSQCPCDGRFTSAVNWPSQAWQENYHIMMIGMLVDMGFKADMLLQRSSNFLINQVQTPGTTNYHYNPYLIGAYTTPALDANNNWFYGQAMWDAWTPGTTWHDTATWPPEAFPSYTDHAYNLIAQTAASFVTPYSNSGLSGQNSYNWLVSANAPFTPQYGQNATSCSGLDVGTCDNPKWDLVPRTTTVTPPVNPCDVNGDGLVNSLDVQIESSEALGLTPCANSLTGTGVCSIVDIQRVINAALGGSCVTGP